MQVHLVEARLSMCLYAQVKNTHARARAYVHVFYLHKIYVTYVIAMYTEFDACTNVFT